MSQYDPYEEPPRRHKHRSRRDRDDYAAEPRYVETRETYVRGSPAALATAPEPPYLGRTTQLARRPIQREDSDLSVEEVRRDFPPPTGQAYVQQSRTIIKNDRQRARSADRYGYDYNDQSYGAYRDDPRRSRDADRRGREAIAVREEVYKPRKRSLSRNQKIIAGVAGAALAVGGKELFDRRGNIKEAPENRNLLGTAAVGAAGAFAGYEGAEFVNKRVNGGEEVVKQKEYVVARDSRGQVAEYYSSEEEPVKRPKQQRRKSIVDQALALVGVGGAKAALDRRDRNYSSDEGRGGRRRRSPENDNIAKIQQAAKAALIAGGLEAVRIRNEPGDWKGAKGKRILTAAIGASAIDAAADRDPDHNSKRHILEAVIGGLAGNRLINGSRGNIEEDRDGRSVHDRSRSRARSRSRNGGGGGSGGGVGGPLAALAAAGLAGLGAKKLADNSRSRSRGDSRRRHYSSDEDDRDSRHGGSKRRSKSVTDRVRGGLASLGIGGAANADRDVRQDQYDSRGGNDRRRRDRYIDDDDQDYRRSSRDLTGPTASGGLAAYEGSRGGRGGGRQAENDYDDTRSQRSGRGGKSRRNKEGIRDRRGAEGKVRDFSSGSSSDLGSSSDDERKARKMKGKQLITAGLATVATIHAAHNVYQSMEKRDERHKAVQEGEMTAEEANKLKMKARLQDAASIAIAGLGIKGAYSEWKEMKEVRDECREFEEKKEERHEKRLQRQKSRQGQNGKPRRPPNRRQKSASNPELHNDYNEQGGYDNYTYQRPSGSSRYVDDNPYSGGAYDYDYTRR